MFTYSCRHDVLNLDSQHKTIRPCKHYRNIRGVHRRFRSFQPLLYLEIKYVYEKAVTNYTCIVKVLFIVVFLYF